MGVLVTGGARVAAGELNGCAMLVVVVIAILAAVITLLGVTVPLAVVITVTVTERNHIEKESALRGRLGTIGGLV